MRAVRLLALLLLTFVAPPAPAQPPDSEIPESFNPRTETFDYERREVMIPMRDGVKLKTVILIPKGVHDAPMLLTRTPYGAARRLGNGGGPHLAAVLADKDVADRLVLEAGYIRVGQDIRGKNDSEGGFVMNRPLAGPLNPTACDESTDAWDTIEWLSKGVPESNGRVGILGISYDGFTALMALVNPHPALRAAVPINPMVDGWMGDDWFHHGAFRTSTFPFVYELEAARADGPRWWSTAYDDYEDLLRAGSAGQWGRSRGLEQLGFFHKVVAHPAYDAFWSQQAVDKTLADRKLTVPTLLVHSLWDQEDIYGALAVWTALKPRDAEGNLFLTIGPWFHHQQRLDGSAVGVISFGADTAAQWRDGVLRPFLDRALKGVTAPTLPTVSAFQTGANRWQSLPGWPAGEGSGGRIEPAAIYLQPGGSLGFERPAAESSAAYVSDPDKPVPFIPRPVRASGDTWSHWLTSDQRDVSARPDVLSFCTAPLTAPLTVAGRPEARMVESITGSDVDVVVKLIDVYPDQVGRSLGLGGYQLMVAADILRGRYREGFEQAKAVEPGKKLAYRFPLPAVNHTFLPGHRVMVQVQSSWFPLYDRNPQTFVENIFWAKPEDYQAATVNVWLGGEAPSAVVLPVVRERGSPPPTR